MEECALSQEQVAQYVGKSRPTIANTLRLLRLPPEIQKALKEGTLTEGHARPLLALDSPELQLKVFREIHQKNLNVRQVEALIHSYTTPKPSKPAKAPAPPSAWDLQVREVEKALTYKLHAPVQLKARPQGGGELRIQFSSPDDLERLLELLGVKA
jgi:ParB family chromosome partitioning protein